MGQVVHNVRLPQRGQEPADGVPHAVANGKPQREPCRIVVVDPHPYAAEGLRALLNALTDDMEVVATSADTGLAPDQVDRHRADLLIVEPRTRGVLSMIKVIRQSSESTRIVALTSEENRHHAAQVIRAGAHAYISKHIAPAELICVLQVVRAGRVVVSASATGALFDAPGSSAGGLTAQERTLLKLIIDGLDNGEMARRLMVSESTLKRTIHRLLKKLHARNRVEAAVHAASHGLLDDA